MMVKGDHDLFDVIDQLRGLVLVPPFVIPILSVCPTVTSQSSTKMVRDRPKLTIALYQLDPWLLSGPISDPIRLPVGHKDGVV